MPLKFLGAQLLMLNPVNAFIWVHGLWFVLFHREGKQFRFLGFIYLAYLAIMMALRGKDYYLAPIYPMLFAAGAVYRERLSESRPRLRWTRTALPIAVIVTGILAAPYALPILSPERFLAYSEAIDIKTPRTETSMSGRSAMSLAGKKWSAPLPACTTPFPLSSGRKLPFSAAITGEAAAIDFFGPQDGLPKAISAPKTTIIGARASTRENRQFCWAEPKGAEYWCGTVEKGPENAPYYGMVWEHYTILVCRDFKVPLIQA